jgi:hypothetical protein
MRYSSLTIVSESIEIYEIYELLAMRISKSFILSDIEKSALYIICLRIIHWFKDPSYYFITCLVFIFLDIFYKIFYFKFLFFYFFILLFFVFLFYYVFIYFSSSFF